MSVALPVSGLILAFADRALRVLAVVLLLGLLACVVLGVLFRQLNHPLAWSDEMAQYFLVWTGFTGWVIASRKRSHIRITMIIDMLPSGLRRFLEVLIQLCVALLGALMIWHSLTLINRNWDMESVSVPLTAAILYMPLPATGAIIVLQALAEAWQAATGRGQPAPDTSLQPL